MIGESTIRGYSEKPAVQTGSQISSETPLLPLSQGEYDEPIGLPLIVVCQNVDKMDFLERECGYKEELFDFIQQFLRTILLKRTPSSLKTSNSRWCIITLSLTRPPEFASFLTITAIPFRGLTTTHPSPTVHRDSKTKCCRSRTRLSSEWMGLMGQNSCFARWL